MTNKKAPVAPGAEGNSTLGLYPKPTRRSRLDRRIKILLFINIFLITSLAIVHLDRVNVQRQLTQTLWQLEEARAENDTLWGSVLLLQTENDDLNAQNAVLKTPIKTSLPICSSSSFKSWMNYRAITAKASKQYKLQLQATTDPFYGFRMIDGYIAVAMGPQYGPVGTKYIIQFEDGKVIQAIIGDIKHEGCISKPDGSALEFIIDKNVIPVNIKSSGNFNDVFQGSIVMIREVE